MAAVRIAGIGPSLLAVGLLLAGAVAQQPGEPFAVATPSGEKVLRCEPITVTLNDDEGRPSVRMHAYGYVSDDPHKAVTFFWNGGPGWSTSLLHMGFAAPRIADLVDGTGMHDNPLTLVDRTDVIYVDPVGTGFSRAIEPSELADFWGVDEDAEVAARFVARVIAERGWQQRPLYLCGESYGGIRVAAMLAPLRELGIVPDGLVMISPALECRALSPRRDSDDYEIARADAVPTMAALQVAWGKRTVPDRRADIDAVCAMANGPLLTAVRAGVDFGDVGVDHPKYGSLRRAVEEYTGGTPLRRVRGRDRYDARLKARAARTGGILRKALEKSLREVLQQSFGVEDVKKYRSQAPRTGIVWRGEGRKSLFRSDIRATRMVATACKDGSGPRLFVAGGWYDMVCQFAVARRLEKDRAFGKCDVTVRDYPGGHMIYVDPDGHEQLVADLRTWYDLRPR